MSDDSGNRLSWAHGRPGEIPQGLPLFAYRHGNETVYCTAGVIYRMALQFRDSWRVCLASRGPRKSELDSWEMMRPDTGWLNLQHPVSFTPTKEMSQGGRFRWELIYEGLDGATVNMLYREFVGDLVRPGFQQELKYTLTNPGPTEIRFRTAKLRIVSADNNGINYEVLNGLKAK
jgi:hypothetical protein